MTVVLKRNSLKQGSLERQFSYHRGAEGPRGRGAEGPRGRGAEGRQGPKADRELGGGYIGYFFDFYGFS